MPNWANGHVFITGERDNIAQFLSRFLYEDHDVDLNEKFLARSFCNGTYQNTIKHLDEHIDKQATNDTYTYDVVVNFAWSAYTCLIDGYPQKK